MRNKARTTEKLRIQDFVELRREAHTAVAHLMLHEERQYSYQFAKALSVKGGTEASEQVHWIIDQWNRHQQSQSKQVVQTVPSTLSSTSGKYMQWLRQVSASHPVFIPNVLFGNGP